MDKDLLAKAKSLGFSDRQIAHLTQRTESEVRAERHALGLVPGFRLVDTCAAEFEAYTPYYYSSYDQGDDEVRPSDTKKVMILGSGPNRIGQGIEFDYCCVHAAFALKEEGLESLMVNSNPETVSTDYDTSDKLFFEPLTLEDVLHIYHREKCWGAIAQFGGQTPLNLALDLQANDVNIIGTSPQSIERAEDREMFADMLHALDIPQPPNGLATNEAEALEASAKLSYPVLVRPSFVLGGRAMQIVYSDDELCRYMRTAVEASPERPVLVDKFLEDATEVDVDCIADAKNGTFVIGGMLEHVEFAGVHSGDAAMVMPPHALSQSAIDTMRARGVRPSSAPTCSVPIAISAAPSTMPEELPAWWTWLIFSTQWYFSSATSSKPASAPIWAKDALRPARPSTLVSGRISSSWSRTVRPFSSLTGMTESAK